jgi:phosphate transport system permease protein
MNKYLKESIFRVLMIISVFIVMVYLVIIIGINIVKGGIVLINNPAVIFTEPGPKYLLGGEGGILHAISGSVLMVIPSTCIACAASYLIALFLQADYIKNRLSNKIRVVFDVLWGIPSIIYGIFILNILIVMNRRGSLGAGIVTLALLQMPIIVRYMDEALNSVPNGIRESAYSLGATRLETAFTTAKYALPGIIAGVLIGMGRAMGDAASVIFTSGAGNTMPKGLSKSASSLPVLIFQQANSFYPSVREHAYAASFILIIIIIVLNTLSRICSKHFQKYTPGSDR